ncbi:MAG: phosphate ABC transporter substrate-binding protein [Alphaproteobacteria bacterium]|nr:MAG: phosphate ABC transporter substrate-binding protein [Alphaproteobacteria bacterium]
MKLSHFFASLSTIMLLFVQSAHGRDHMRIVGSSTVYPFVATVAERFSDRTGITAPIVESIGTGAGFMEFCKGVGERTPDMVNASRPIKESERTLCNDHDVGEIYEIPIGKDGVVLASSKQGAPLPLTLSHIFLALAAKVPHEGKLIANPYKNWHDIDPALPDAPILFYGPAATSGTRDAFVELAMQPPCEHLPEFIAAYPDKSARGKACHMLREDGVYSEAGENDNLIIQKLVLNPKTVGIFGFSYLEQNAHSLMAHPVNGVEPSYDSIFTGSYPIARTLFVYAKERHMREVKGMREFLDELTSDTALADDGYLVWKGLIPPKAVDRINARTLLGLGNKQIK